MLVQLVCRSDKHPDLTNTVIEPFEWDGSSLGIPIPILVPDIESYHEVRGHLTLVGMAGEVICLPPPSEYKPNVGTVPYALVHPGYTAKCDPIGEPDSNKLQHLCYYFEKKDAATTNEVHE